MIFPELGSVYYDDRDRGIRDRMEAFYAESITTNLAFWQEADIDTRFYAGDQTIWNDVYYGNLPANRRRQFQFNRILRTINMIEGYQRRNRKSLIAVPIENGDTETADQFTKIFLWMQQQENYLETISDAFHGALITGLNLLQVWVDYRNDPISGNIRVDNCSYNTFLIDPFFKKADLSDCNALWKRSFLTKRECISLMPEYADEILHLYANDNGTGRDGKFQFTPESYGYSYKNLLTYDEFYYRDFRSQKMILDPQSGESMEWRGDEERLKMFLRVYPDLKVVEQDIPTVNLAIVIQGKTFYNGPQPNGLDTYNFIPVFGYYTPELPYWPYRVQGVVRQLRDSQYLYNRRRIIELDLLESQINSGWKYKEDALVNPKDVFLYGQGRGLALKQEANMTDVEQIPPPQVPPSMIQLSELLAKEVMEISGVSEELLGASNDQVAGVLSALRQAAGLTTLQRLFDQLDQSQRLLGKLFINIIQTNFTPGKVKKILNKEPSDQFYNKNFGRYDAAVEEGLNTQTQRQMQFAQMLQLREVGVPIPDTSLLEAATIQNKKDIIDAIKQQQQQAQQLQMQQAQLQMQQLAAQTDLAQARAEADRGLGIERASRVQENQALAVERRAAAIKDQEQAVLSAVKALKEIEGLDLAHLEKLVTLTRSLQSHESPEVPV